MSGRTRPLLRRPVLSVGVLAALAAVAVVLGYGLRTGEAEASRSALVGSPAPRLHGRTLAGREFDGRQLRGSVVLVNVWASWCAPCRDELPLLVSTARRYRGDDLVLVTINSRDGAGPARDFLRGLEASGLAARSITDPDAALAVTWGVTGMPETFLLDRHGIVRARRLGPVDGPWLSNHLSALGIGP